MMLQGKLIAFMILYCAATIQGADDGENKTAAAKAAIYVQNLTSKIQRLTVSHTDSGGTSLFIQPSSTEKPHAALPDIEIDYEPRIVFAEQYIPTDDVRVLLKSGIDAPIVISQDPKFGDIVLQRKDGTVFPFVAPNLDAIRYRKGEIVRLTKKVGEAQNTIAMLTTALAATEKALERANMAAQKMQEQQTERH
ncbi:MAG TPA: hypothetical protein VLG71_00065 [Candidatus Limnocylindria bacterium]|nr:hypothetical protein [Candidatus Limnocylindria bacterium]